MRRSILLASMVSLVSLASACSSNDDAGTPQNDADPIDSAGGDASSETSPDSTPDSSPDADASTDSSVDAPAPAAGWDTRFALPGLQGSNVGGVNAMVVTPKRWIYVAGQFHHAGSTPAKNVAVWNGLKWNALGDGLDGEVTGLAATATEDVIAVVAHGTTSDLWLWNKTSWSKMSATFDGRVRSIDVGSDSTIWVAGDFTKVNAVAAPHVAKLKDATWTSAGFAHDSGVDVVRATKDGACVGGGIDGDDFGVECWNGTTWKSYRSNLETGRVHALRVDAKGALVAAGEFANAPDFPEAGSIARWNATTEKWDLIGGGVVGFLASPGHLEDVVTFGDNVYVTGYFATAGALSVRHSAMWDGKKWWDLDGGLGKEWGVTFGDFPPARVLAVDEGGEVYAGGGLTRAGSVNVFDIAHWDGTAWNAVDDPTATRLGVNGVAEAITVGSDGSAYVGGTFGYVGRDVAVSNVARLSPDGSWSSLGAGLDDTVLGLAASGPDLWTVGRFQGSGRTATGAPLISAKGVAHWNGKTWTGVGGGVDGTATSIAIAPDNKIWIGGEFTHAGTLEANHLAVWDGAKWSAIAGGITGDEFGTRVSAILFHDGKVYVGGSFKKAGSVDASNIAVWDGTAWSALGTGFEDGVDSLGWYGGKLVAGGSFKDKGHLATWDGTAWTPLGGGIHGETTDAGGTPYETFASVYAIGVRGTDLFAIGMFDVAGTMPVKHLARFDGTAWSKVDAELDDLGTDLFVASDSLWISGAFGSVGNVGSVGVGRWVFAK
jgi:hypothetical protein